MKSLPTFLYVPILIFLWVVNAHSTPELIISNNGPTVLDSYITFSVNLRNFVPVHKLKYIFDDCVQKTEYPNQALNITIVKAFPSSLYKDKSYVMNITAISTFFWEETVASNFSKFDLKRDLIGQIDVYRDEEKHAIDVDEVAIGENVSLVVNLVNHGNFLDKAEVDYSWSIDYEKQESLGNTLIYNFTDPGMRDIKAIVTASFPNNVLKFGAYERKVNAKVPVNSVNVTGNPFIYHGDTLNLNVTCNGTPPFVYCFEVLKGNTSTGNFSCTHLSTFTTCRMEIIKYFQKDGRYYVGIYISNNVKEVKRVLEVMVYSVSVNPTLSTIIIPIVCSLLTLIIIAFGISYYVQQRNQLVIEVANFDFQEESDSYTERTFFEKIFDSIICRRCACNNFSCDSPSETEPLV